VLSALKKRPKPILFIDEMHTMVGAGATTGGTMDLANLVKPVLTEGDIRLIGSTTFEEFKHVEKDRALARRVQKITVNEPSLEDTVQILKGLRGRYADHHRVAYTEGAIEAAARLARRHLRDHRLPDSAIDVLDEAGAALRLLSGVAKDGETKTVDVPEIERVVARMARIPEKQASTGSGCGRWRSRCSASSSARRKRCTRRPWRSSAPARAWGIPTIPRAASSSPARPASARRSSPSSSLCTSATSSSATT
jgi:ATP-dependent Clp protease ATP-binding subunit ClpA